MQKTIEDPRPVKCPECGYSPLYHRLNSTRFDCKNPGCRAEFVVDARVIGRGETVEADDLTRICHATEISAAEYRAMNKAAVEASRYSLMVELEQAAQRLLKTDRVIRCVYSSELPEHFTAANEVLGLTGMSLHLPLREFLPCMADAERCILFNGANISANFDNAAEGTRAVFAHELSHIACRGFASMSEPGDSRFAASYSDLQMRCPSPAMAESIFGDDYWVSHNCQFYRALLHVIARAWDEGLEFDCLYEFEPRGLSDPSQYYDALRAEIETLDSQPLIEALRSSEPPAGFVGLFESDVARVRGAQ